MDTSEYTHVDTHQGWNLRRYDVVADDDDDDDAGDDNDDDDDASAPDGDKWGAGCGVVHPCLWLSLALSFLVIIIVIIC